MLDSEVVRPSVFLSSVFREKIGDAWPYVPLRKRILDERSALPVDLWAYDIFWREGSETPDPDADTIVDRCFDGVRRCDLFVFLLTGRHGTGVGYVPDRVHASYLELELFAAAMLQKPVLVLHQRGREPESGLSDVLYLLRKKFPASLYVVGDDDQLYRRFLDECIQLGNGEKTRRVSALSKMADWLSRKRSHLGFQTELVNPNLRFLDGSTYARKLSNPAKAAELLDQVTSGVRGDSAERRIMPHGVALFRLWSAMRELMDERQSTVADPSIAPLWDRAWGLWGSHASWFGLHGHLLMSPLASVQSQTLLRRKFTDEKAFRAATDVREPVGARASALYSAAQRMGTWRQQVRQFQLSAALATQAIGLNADRAQGALSIRGHTAMQLARRGYVWKIWEAEADFRQSLALRERYDASVAGIGEAMVDLGLCLAVTGRSSKGVRFLQEGIERLRTDDSANGKAFLARALRSLEQGATVALRRDLAMAARVERLALASNIQTMDQVR